MEGGVQEGPERRSKRDARRAEPAHEQPGEASRDDEGKGRDLHRRARVPEGVKTRREQLHGRLADEPDAVRREHVGDQDRRVGRESARLVQRADDLPAQRDARDGGRHDEEHDPAKSDRDPRPQLLVGPSPRRGHRVTRQLRQGNCRDRHPEQADGQDLDQLSIAERRNATRPGEGAEQGVDETRELGDTRSHQEGEPRDHDAPYTFGSYGESHGNALEQPPARR